MSEVSVVISTCDKYSDCWGPLAHGLDKYWPDCPYPIYLVTNVRDFPHPRIQVIKTAKDMGWGERTAHALRRIDSPYILYMLEDFWIKRRVNSRSITDYVRYLEDGSAYYIGLMPFFTMGWDMLPFPRDRRLGVLTRSASYRTALQAALWNKEVFLELLRTEESPWEFELIGTERSRKYEDKFLWIKREPWGTCENGIKYTWSAVIGGCWSLSAKLYARSEGLEIDFSKRPSEPWTRWLGRTRPGRMTRFSWDVAKILATDRGRFLLKFTEHCHNFGSLFKQ
jgi:hypothetical protein